MDEFKEQQMLALLQQFKDKLPIEKYKDTEDLIVHREWGVGLENLCEQLYEHDVPVTPAALSKIKELAELMNLKPKTWIFLEKPK